MASVDTRGVDPRRLLIGTILGLAALLACMHLVWALVSASLPWPLEYRESAMVLSTRLLLQGTNPYGLAVQPELMNVYGIGYPVVVWPFASLFGASLQVHRYRALRFDHVPRALAAAGALLVLAHFTHDLTVAARPDSVGFLLFFLSLVIPWRRDFTVSSLALACVFGAAAFLTKPYFVVGLPLIALYLGLFRSLRGAVVFGAAAAAALVVVVFVVNASFESYFTNTFFIHRDVASRDFGHLMRELPHAMLLNCGALAALVIASLPRSVVGVGVGAGIARQRGGGISPWPMAFPTFILLVNASLMVTWLGWHNGNGILYYNHLVVPFLVWVAVRRMATSSSVLALAAFALGLLFLIFRSQPLPNQQSEGWDVLRGIAQGPARVLAPPTLSVWLDDANKPIFDGGSTEYCGAVAGNTMVTISTAYQERCAALGHSIDDGIRTQVFDYIVATPLSPLIKRELLSKHYQLVIELELSTPFQHLAHEVWQPRRN